MEVVMEVQFKVEEKNAQRSVNLKKGGGVKLKEKENKFNIIKHVKII